MEAAQAKNWNVAIENFIKAGEVYLTQEAVWVRVHEGDRAANPALRVEEQWRRSLS